MPTSNTAAINAASRPLTQQDYKTLSLAALGGALEFYDFIIFVFFANAIGQLFFPPEMPDRPRSAVQANRAKRPPCRSETRTSIRAANCPWFHRRPGFDFRPLLGFWLLFPTGP